MTTCTICRTEFEPHPKRPNQRTCSKSCGRRSTMREVSDRAPRREPGRAAIEQAVSELEAFGCELYRRLYGGVPAGEVRHGAAMLLLRAHYGVTE